MELNTTEIHPNDTKKKLLKVVDEKLVNFVKAVLEN